MYLTSHFWYDRLPFWLWVFSTPSYNSITMQISTILSSLSLVCSGSAAFFMHVTQSSWQFSQLK